MPPWRAKRCPKNGAGLTGGFQPTSRRLRSTWTWSNIHKESLRVVLTMKHLDFRRENGATLFKSRSFGAQVRLNLWADDSASWCAVPYKGLPTERSYVLLEENRRHIYRYIYIQRIWPLLLLVFIFISLELTMKIFSFLVNDSPFCFSWELHMSSKKESRHFYKSCTMATFRRAFLGVKGLKFLHGC